jgi:AcrR family transcriptional regulator
MARPKNSDGQRTRQAILDAALELFADNGYFGTSLRDVASAVGVRESAIYNYFKSKEALFDALLTAHEETRRERMAALADPAPIADATALLERVTVSGLEAFADVREQRFFRLLMSDGHRLARTGSFNLMERLGGGLERMQALMHRLIREGWLRKADPLVLAMSFGGPLLVWRHLHTVGSNAPAIRSPRAFARHHVAQFMLGAAAPRATRSGRKKTAASRKSS